MDLSELYLFMAIPLILCLGFCVIYALIHTIRLNRRPTQPPTSPVVRTQAYRVRDNNPLPDVNVRPHVEER